ncbi:MAG: delta(1)-pyrroline-2-carboxylate reductase family protein, partial [Gemmataceae bacterium]|nr:delta(1)-pyrroline-2-carboxylate reductase family protein [Gemmataceae bacterium]
MRTLDPDQTRQVLPYPAVTDAVAAVLRDSAAGLAHVPPRLHLPLPESGVLLVMPAADDTLAITKLVTVHPSNASRRLPSVQGEAIVLDARTGRRLLALDGATVTAVRTAAVSALAARLLAPNPAGDLLLVGAGVQAVAHLECFAALFGTRRAFVCSRGGERVEVLIRRGRELGVEVVRVGAAAEVLPAVRVVVTATTSRTPVLPPDVTPGTFVSAVGAYTPDMTELPADLVRRACGPGSVLVTDTPAARHEAGDLTQANIDSVAVPSLADLFDRRPDVADVAVFKSVGHALWDLAAARVAVEHL